MLFPPEIYRLALHRTGGQFRACLGFTPAPFDSLLAIAAQYLHATELEVYRTFLHDRRRESFLRGRYIAKQVLLDYLQEKNPRRIRLESGVFDHPLVVHSSPSTPQISLSHTQEWAAGLAFSEAHPMGLDLEAIASSNAATIHSQVTSHEIGLHRTLADDENTFYTRLWTIKEALSKVLKTGLMTPFDVYQVETLRAGDGYTVGTFRNFGQYKALSFQWENNLCSIILPRETHCVLPPALVGRRPGPPEPRNRCLSGPDD
ncbi:MAG: 4'-phosphopantetheinyl transferase superfamily protein [Ferruginibacter sp.]|nr:4'-phosphopantetheinyl transferase superfamily protein [Cytophagales bacterium]